MYAIAGVTGHVGSAAAETLLAQGKSLRVIVREPAKAAAWKARGVEVVVAELSDEAAITKALTGVEGAFLLLPPEVATPTPLENNAKLSATLARAIKASKLPHVVLLSSVGAQHDGGNGPIRALHRAEQDFAATGAAFTAVRASSFQENWGASLGALAQGILPTFIPAGFRYPQVASKDIGRTVAAALVEGGKPGVKRVIELAGPRDYSPTEVAAELAKLTGKPVVAHEAPLDAVVPTFTGFGISPAVAALFREMFAGIASGRVAFETPHQVRGTVEIGETLKAMLG